MPFPRMERVSSRNLILGSEKPSFGSSNFVLNVACGNSVLIFNSESLFTQTFSSKIFARGLPPGQSWAVWPDCAIYWTLGNFSKPLVTINLPKSSTFLGNFWKGIKIDHFPSEITLIDIWGFFSGHTGHEGQFFLRTLLEALMVPFRNLEYNLIWSSMNKCVVNFHLIFLNFLIADKLKFTFVLTLKWTLNWMVTAEYFNSSKSFY